MNCQICNRESTDRYCDDCKHIRSVYVIHKLAPEISPNEKINTNTLIIKKLKNIEKYDLELLEQNGILTRDRLNNYSWTNVDAINEYLKEHDKSNKSITFKIDDIDEKIPATDEVLLFLEKNYNITDTFDQDQLSAQLNTNKNQTKKIIEKLADEKLIKKSFYGNYKLDYHQIIKYKKKNKLNEDKIKTLNNIKQPPTDANLKRKSNTVKDESKKKNSRQRYKKDKSKTNGKSSQSNKKKKQDNYKTSQKISEVDDKTASTQFDMDNQIIPIIRDYINTMLIILPRNVNESDLTLMELYDEFKKCTNSNISQDDFNMYFHRVINTYPHIRHNHQDNTIKYNIKSRRTPQIILEDIQANNQKFTYNENCRVRLKENLLEIDTDIAKEEFAQLYNLIVYTHENIKNYSYHVLNDKIHIEITYDLTDENPELWLKFIKSYNLYMD